MGHFRKKQGYFLEKWQESLLNDLYNLFDIEKKKGSGYYLDIGTGGRAYSVVGMAIKGIKSVGINIAEKDIGDVINNLRDVKSLGESDIKVFFVADAQALPFKGEMFKHISCISTLEHISDGPQVIKEISRVIESGGKLFVLVPNDYKLIPKIAKWHYRWIDKEWGEHIHYSVSTLIDMFRDIGEMDILRFGYRGHLIKIIQEFLLILLPNRRWSSKIWWKLEKRDKQLENNPHAVHVWMAFVKR